MKSAVIAIAASLLLLTSCASTPPKPVATPAWDSVPGTVLDALCQRLLDDGVGSSGAPVGVVRTTQPIATPQAVAALGAMTTRGGKASGERVAEALRAGQRTIPVQLGGPACSWRAVKALDATRHADAMIVEISAPIVNPFGRGEPGLIVRVSLGGTHPAWYWIPLAQYRGGWAIGRVLPLLM